MNTIIAALNYTGENEEYKAALNDHLDFIFIDWFNNFLTVDRFAEYYGLEIEQAKKAIEAGRKIHDKRAEALKNELLNP